MTDDRIFFSEKGPTLKFYATATAAEDRPTIVSEVRLDMLTREQVEYILSNNLDELERRGAFMETTAASQDEATTVKLQLTEQYVGRRGCKSRVESVAIPGPASEAEIRPLFETIMDHVYGDER